MNPQIELKDVNFPIEMAYIVCYAINKNRFVQKHINIFWEPGDNGKFYKFP